MKLHKKIIILIIVFVVYFIYKISFSSKSQTTTYQTVNPTINTIVVSVNASGVVSSANSASVTTQASGVVKKIYVKNSDQIKSGQLIGELELDEISKQKYQSAYSSYQSAKNSLVSAQSTLYSLQSKLFSANRTLINDAVARNLAVDDPTYIMQNADWLAAESTYKNQQSVIAQSQSNLNSAWALLRQSSPQIYAPISGEINGIWLQIGSVISGSDTKIASITTKAKPTITINLTEIDIPKVKIGQKAILVFDAFDGKTFSGTVSSVDKVGNISSGVTTYPTTILMDSYNESIIPNMSASVTIILDTKADVLTIPSSAITENDGAFTVSVLQNKTPKIVTIQTGLSSGTLTEITSGLKESDLVITQTNTKTSNTSNQTRSVFSGFGVGSGGVRINR